VNLLTLFYALREIYFQKKAIIQVTDTSDGIEEGIEESFKEWHYS